MLLSTEYITSYIIISLTMQTKKSGLILTKQRPTNIYLHMCTECTIPGGTVVDDEQDLMNSAGSGVQLPLL